MAIRSCMLVVSEARLAPMALAISAAHCSGGAETINQPTTRPVIAGNPLCSDQNSATRSTQLKSSARPGLFRLTILSKVPVNTSYFSYH